MSRATDDDIRRLRQELAAAPTHAEAVAIFKNSERIFVSMSPEESEPLYEEIEKIISEKPK